MGQHDVPGNLAKRVHGDKRPCRKGRLQEAQSPNKFWDWFIFTEGGQMQRGNSGFIFGGSISDMKSAVCRHLSKLNRQTALGRAAIELHTGLAWKVPSEVIERLVLA